MSDILRPTMTIDGMATEAAESFEVINPATEQVIAHVPNASAAELNAAVAAARAAFPAWRNTDPEARRAMVRKLAQSLVERAEECTTLLTREQGKPLADSRMEVGAAVYWLNAVADQAVPVEVVQDDATRRIETRHVPLGVVGAIAPWNFPVGLGAWKIAPALVTGNTLVLKPSPFTPLSTLLIGEIGRDILPPGVFNVITGDDQLGPLMTAHPDIDKISFTGSTQTGKAIMANAAETLKRITLELGGNDPAIVLPDVDPAAIAPKLFWAAFSNNAQFCLATKRMYVHADVYESVRDALVAYARTVQVGDGAAEGSQIGPIQNRKQYARIVELLRDSHAHGVSFALGGEVGTGPGLFVPVAIADNPPEESRIVAEEAFGPILPLLRYNDIDEAVARANASSYGLGASVWGRDLAVAQSVADRLESGTVWINTIHELGPHFSFAGHKQSGFGIENGQAGLLEYTLPQTVVVAKN